MAKLPPKDVVIRWTNRQILEWLQKVLFRSKSELIVKQVVGGVPGLPSGLRDQGYNRRQIAGESLPLNFEGYLSLINLYLVITPLNDYYFKLFQFIKFRNI